MTMTMTNTKTTTMEGQPSFSPGVQIGSQHQSWWRKLLPQVGHVKIHWDSWMQPHSPGSVRLPVWIMVAVVSDRSEMIPIALRHCFPAGLNYFTGSAVVQQRSWTLAQRHQGLERAEKPVLNWDGVLQLMRPIIMSGCTKTETWLRLRINTSTV